MHYFRDIYAFLKNIFLSKLFPSIFDIIIFLMINNKRKYFLCTHLFFYVLISQINKYIFEKNMILFFIKFEFLK